MNRDFASFRGHVQTVCGGFVGLSPGAPPSGSIMQLASRFLAGSESGEPGDADMLDIYLLGACYGVGQDVRRTRAMLMLAEKMWGSASWPEDRKRRFCDHLLVGLVSRLMAHTPGYEQGLRWDCAKATTVEEAVAAATELGSYAAADIVRMRDEPGQDRRAEIAARVVRGMHENVNAADTAVLLWMEAADLTVD